MTHTRAKKAFPVIIGIVLMINTWNCNKQPLDNAADSQQTLAPPTNFTVQAVSDREVRLQWDHAGNATGFRLEGRQEMMAFKELAHLPGSARSYTDSSGILIGLAFYYRLRAVADAKESEAAEVTGTLLFPQPGDLNIRLLSLNAVRLNWSDQSGFEEGFLIERRTGDAGFLELGRVGANTMSYTDSTGVQIGVLYRYRLSAFTSLNRSRAVEREMNLVLSAPTKLQITFGEGYNVHLSWDDRNVYEDGYIVERQTAGLNYREIARVDSNQTSFTDRTRIQSNQEYRYRVAAHLSQQHSDWKESNAFYMAPDFLVFVSVPGGTFTMGDFVGVGSADERPLHAVSISPFYMSKYEITFDQYDAFCEATGRNKPNDVGWGRGNQPVINVSWLDARAYCEWLSEQLGYLVRLPTEAEWEYASRSAGKNELWSGTSDVNRLGDFAWYGNNSGNQPHSFGQKQVNGLNLHDMTGNVWEWCSDWYDSTYYEYSPQIDPSGPASGVKRILRGGSWGNANSCRTTNRSKSQPDVKYYEYGFRIVRPSGR